VAKYIGSQRVSERDRMRVQPNTASVRRANAFSVIPPPVTYREEVVPPDEGPDLRWRQTLACTKAMDGKPAKKPVLTDALVEDKLIPFALEVERYEQEKGEGAANERWPGLYWAYRQYNKRHVPELAGVPDMIEAYLMTGMSPEEIANETLVHLEHIWWYEKAFFDARAFLDHATWIMPYVFYPRLHAKVTARTSDVLWKLISWKNTCGVPGLRAVISFNGEYADNVRQQISGRMPIMCASRSAG